MVCIAAVADVHVGRDSYDALLAAYGDVGACADLLLIAGDLTRLGDPAEAAPLARALGEVDVPVVAVLGNHDYHADAADEIRALLEQAGVHVLEGECAIFDVGGERLGIAGAKGFGGGFRGASGSDFGEPEMKAFMRHTQAIAARLEERLRHIADCDSRIALLHYSPTADTLRGERLEIYPFLGSYYLAEAIDATRPDLVLHGHAHAGSFAGATPGGVPVRNVALPVIGRPYELFTLDRGRLVEQVERPTVPA